MYVRLTLGTFLQMAMYGRIDILSPTSPDLCVHPLGAVGVLRRRQPRALTESADQLVEQFILRFCLARLMTGA
jgi:hypothetical protein